MSTPTGFMEYKRQLPGDRDPEQRVKDWEEFHHHLSEDELQTQGALHGLRNPLLPYRN